MLVCLNQNNCVVRREAKDPLPRNGGWGSAESQLYYWIKKELILQGYDVVKRRMQSDGHMYGTKTLPYIRERRHKFYIYDGNYTIRKLDEEYRDKGMVTLLVQRNDLDINRVGK